MNKNQKGLERLYRAYCYLDDHCEATLRINSDLYDLSDKFLKFGLDEINIVRCIVFSVDGYIIASYDNIDNFILIDGKSTHYEIMDKYNK